MELRREPVRPFRPSSVARIDLICQWMNLVQKKVALLPGTRLQGQLLIMNPLTHQEIANYLANYGLGTWSSPEKVSSGLLDDRVSNALRHTDICILSVTAPQVPERSEHIRERSFTRETAFAYPGGRGCLQVVCSMWIFSLVFTRPSGLFLGGTPLDDYDPVHYPSCI